MAFTAWRARSRGTAALLLVVAAVLGSTNPALAASNQDRDQADNYYDFTYKSDKGITSASSSIILKRHDPVQFTVAVGENHGHSLYGRVVLELARAKAMHYGGTMTFTVTDDSGTTAYTADEPIDVTLRAKRGRRSEKFRFPFTVPDGHYNVTATFSSN